MIGLVPLLLLDPARPGIFPPCPFHALTGWHCPGCGSLRATHQLLNGRIAAAFALNPLMVLCLPILAALCVRPSWRYRVWLPKVSLVVLLTYWVVRNLPFWPFDRLAPHSL